MTSSFPNFDELQNLLDALCEETITPEQQRRLEELIRTQPEAEAHYIQYMTMYADLSRNFATLPTLTETSLVEHTSETLPFAAPVAESPRRRWWSRRSVWASVGLAGLAAAILVAMTLWQPSRENDRPGPETAEDVVDLSVAVLLQAPGAEWEETSLPTRPGAPLKPGWLHLKSGFAHIEFYSGATVVLEGPADFQLISRTEAYCSRGKLRATVPATAHGFSIGSPQVELVDLGTEFGLQVGGGDKTEVHVFEGKVELYDPGTKRSAATRKELKTGSGVRLDGPGAAEAIASESSSFKTVRDLALKKNAEILRRHEAWLAASKKWSKHPDLSVYYSFQADSTWNRTLVDQVADNHDGAIIGCIWGNGRWSGKQGLEFKQVSDRVRFQLPGEFESITLAAWVRVDSLANRFNSLMMTDGWSEGAPHWHISDDGRLELGVQGANQKNGAHYVSPPVFTSDRLGEWVHLAVVYDDKNQLIIHFVDGVEIKRETLAFSIPLKVGDVELGNWTPGPRRYKSTVRYFSGSMDEFMFFKKALTPAEIEAIYEVGRPPH